MTYLPTQRAKLADEDRQKRDARIAKAMQSGASLHNICSRFGIRHETARMICRQQGLETALPENKR